MRNEAAVPPITSCGCGTSRDRQSKHANAIDDVPIVLTSLVHHRREGRPPIAAHGGNGPGPARSKSSWVVVLTHSTRLITDRSASLIKWEQRTIAIPL
jgi:hypothetical protein